MKEFISKAKTVDEALLTGLVYCICGERMYPKLSGRTTAFGEAGYSYALRRLSIGLYREITPADVEEMVREMAKMDVTTLGHIDLTAEQRRAARWETIGIGREHYYA